MLSGLTPVSSLSAIAREGALPLPGAPAGLLWPLQKDVR